MMDTKRIDVGTSGLVSPAGGGKPHAVETDKKVFRDLLDRSGGILPQKEAISLAGGASALEKLKFSNHAIERMRSRGVTLPPEQMQKLAEGVERARSKGSKDSLVIVNDSAFVVSVKNNTVVTVMDRSQMQENVFTNIDSTVLM